MLTRWRRLQGPTTEHNRALARFLVGVCWRYAAFSDANAVMENAKVDDGERLTQADAAACGQVALEEVLALGPQVELKHDIVYHACSCCRAVPVGKSSRRRVCVWELMCMQATIGAGYLRAAATQTARAGSPPWSSPSGSLSSTSPSRSWSAACSRAAQRVARCAQGQ
jgi:hypothetical protein